MRGSTKRKKKRSPEAIEKQRATMKAKRALRDSPEGEKISDAIIYLRQAEASVNARLASGKLKRIDNSHLLTMLALKRLEGEI
jgi:hypothetical protein